MLLSLGRLEYDHFLTVALELSPDLLQIRPQVSDLLGLLRNHDVLLLNQLRHTSIGVRLLLGCVLLRRRFHRLVLLLRLLRFYGFAIVHIFVDGNVPDLAQDVVLEE